MANIDEYIKQIQQAQYGEEVRGSIVNALKKVNDDNNSYVAIKKEVVAAKDIVEEKAEIFDEKANAAKETLTALQASTQIANEAKSSLNNIISSAISTKKELEQAVLETGEVIARVDDAKSNLDKSITSAGEAELNLQQQIDTSNQIKNQLDVSNNTAIELKKNLDVAINEANIAKVKLVEAINNAGNAALEKIETAQSVATRAVETAKVEAVKAVQTEGTTETKKVTDEGAKQVQTVQSIGTQETEKVTAEGTKQVGLVKTEGEKHLASVQTAAQEIIADREQIAKNKTDIAELRQNKADAIIETASGTLLNVKDSSGAFFEDFSMSGKSEQNGTPTPDTPVPIVNAGENGKIEVKVVGKNILDVETATPKGWNLDITNLSNFEAGRTYTMTVVSLNDSSCGLFLDDHNKLVTYLNPGQSASFVMPDKSTFKKMSLCGGTATALLKDRSKVKVQIQLGNKSTAYEPYKEPQTLTLQLDRPLTKWDKLERREGVWGIARQGETKVLKATPEEKWAAWEDKQNAFFIMNDKIIKEGLCSHFEAKGSFEIGKETGIYLSETVHLIVTDMNINSLESWKTWLQANPITATYKTAEETWEPLPEEMQSVLNALHTNYPTTVVTNSEDTEMELSYIADTKNYYLNREQVLQNQILDIQNALISQKISGGGIKVTNSAKLPIAKLSVFGKSEQITTTGANLFNALTITEKHWLNTENGNIEPASTFWTSDFIEVEEGDYCLTEKGTNRNCGYDEGKNFVKALLASKGKITVTSGIKFIRVSGVYETIKPNNLMINRGPTTKPYEPYTGGKPSPSTEYPQEITSCGDKGTIEIKVTGKNLIPFPYPAISGNKGTKNGITWEVLTDGGIRLQGTASTAFYLDLDNNLKIGNTLIVPGNTDGKIAVNKDVTYNGNIAKVYIAVVKGMTVNRVYYPQIEYGTISTSYEPYREPQELTLPTQNGLPGLKVDGNGNYTDETGQQWIADEIDLARGKYVQRIARRMFDGNEQLGDNLGGKTSLWLRVDNIRPETGLCNYGKIVKANTIEQEELSFSVSSSGIYLYTTKTAVEFKNLLKQKYDSGKPVEVLYALKTPIETDLPPETLAAFKQLHTNYPNTIISNDADAGMELSYVVDTKNYIDKKFEELNQAIVNTQIALL